MSLEGLYTVCITPFDAKGKLDEEGMRSNFHRQLQQGVEGFVVLGTTSESPTLAHEEKKRVIQIAVEEIKGKGTLWVGTGNYSTDQTITSTIEAKEMGADGALIITPYYNKPTQEGLYRHFAAICSAVDFPICIYNNPTRTGQNMETATLQRLFSFPSIVAVKESSGNIMHMTDILEIVRNSHPRIRVMSGDDPITFPLLSLGGHGLFSIASNLIPSPINQMVKAALKGDWKKAQTLHFELLPFLKAVFIETNPIPIKAAMTHCGLPAGSCRLPLCNLSSLNDQKLKQLLSTIPSSWLNLHG